MGTFAHTDLVSHPIDGDYRGHGPRDTVGVFWGNYLDASSEAMADVPRPRWAVRSWG